MLFSRSDGMPIELVVAHMSLCSAQESSVAYAIAVWMMVWVAGVLGGGGGGRRQCRRSISSP